MPPRPSPSLPARTRVLVAMAQDAEELHRARRHLGYDRLVAFVPDSKGAAGRLAKALASEHGAEVEELPSHDLLACMERIEARLRALEGPAPARPTTARPAAPRRGSTRTNTPRPVEVRVVVDGGTVAMQGGALLACLSTGTEAWFLMHKPVRLPVLRAMPVEERFTPEQVAVLRAFDVSDLQGAADEAATATSTRIPIAEVTRRSGLEDARAKEALLALRKLDAVVTDANGAALTRLGRYYRGALPAAPSTATEAA